MRATRRLVLRREVLTELGSDELALVVGAEPETTPVGWCVGQVTSRVFECDSLLRPCISNTCTR